MIDLLLRLSRRERALLALAVFFVLPLAVVGGVIWPLHERVAAAREARAEALALQQWVAGRIDERARLERAPAVRVDAVIGLAGVEASLRDAGLRSDIASLGVRADGNVELRFDSVDFVRLADWLSEVHPGWGYRIVGYRFEAGDRPARVAARLILSPRPS